MGQRLSDDELAAKAADWRRMKDQADELKAQAKTVGEELLAELGRRRTAQLPDVGGWQISRRSKWAVAYDADAAKATLPAAVFRRIAPPTVSRVLLAAELAAGNVTPEQVATFETRTRSAPWVDVVPVRTGKPKGRR
jgi:hypothetical protein